MNLYGELDLSAFFGVEIRVFDGEEHICIPRRFNPAIQSINGRPLLLMDVREREKPDGDGYTHVCNPHIPWSRLNALPEADYIKMSAPIGRFRSFARPEKEGPEPEKDNGIGHKQLASNPVTEKDIPL